MATGTSSHSWRSGTTGGVGISLHRLVGAFALFLSAVLPAASALAQAITTNDAVARIFTEEVQADWFDEAFLVQVPADQITQLVTALVGQFGPLVAVEGEGTQLTTRLERATMPTQVRLDDAGRIIGLFFGPPVPIGVGVEGFVAEIAALPGTTSVGVFTNGDLATGHRPELALGVGSAFKLAVLAALVDEVAAGTIAWDDVVTLDAAMRSLPTGILQNWADGTPVTVATLANLMMSASDNTATDTLIALLGRERVETESPRNAPFLTTGEMFRLKSAGGDAAAAAWIAGDEAARRALLGDLAALPLPAVDDFPTSPVFPEIEWFMNAFEICALLDRVGDNPAVSINPGVADAGQWARVAFKGGSEPGALNLSTLVTAEDGTTHCVVATWNHSATLDEAALISLYAGLLAALAAGG